MYDIARHALAEQEARVSSIRAHTSALVAAQALIASFLGRDVLEHGSAGGWGWAAVATLAVGLVVAAAVLAPWNVRFALDVHRVYRGLERQVNDELSHDSLDWLVVVAMVHEELRERNHRTVQRLTTASAALAVMTIVQTGLWTVAIGVE